MRGPEGAQRHRRADGHAGQGGHRAERGANAEQPVLLGEEGHQEPQLPGGLARDHAGHGHAVRQEPGGRRAGRHPADQPDRAARRSQLRLDVQHDVHEHVVAVQPPQEHVIQGRLDGRQTHVVRRTVQPRQRQQTLMMRYYYSV